MLAIFHKAFAHPPEELNSPASHHDGSKKAKLPEETLKEFLSNNPDKTSSLTFGQAAVLAYVRPDRPYSVHQRLFCGLDDIYCLFMGSLNNLCTLNRQYGLLKGGNEAMFVIEAYRTLRDRGPYPADQVVKDLDGSFSFVVYDSKGGTVFAALSIESSRKAVSAGKITVGSFCLPVLPLSVPMTITIRISNIGMETADTAIHSVCTSCGPLEGLVKTKEDEVDAFFSLKNNLETLSLLKKLNHTIIDNCQWSADIIPSNSSPEVMIKNEGAKSKFREQINSCLAELKRHNKIQKLYVEDLENLHLALVDLEAQPAAVS